MSVSRRIFGLLAFMIFASALCGAQQGKALLLRDPALSRTQIAFAFAGDLWIVPRDGGEARRLTAGAGNEGGPVFSPDGALIAFTGEYDGNQDVFVVQAAGGVPRRLTWHPSADRAVGWTPDGKRVLFRSDRGAQTFAISRLFTVPVEGGFPAELPLERAVEGSFSPDASHIAYVPTLQWQSAWKRYRGGQTRPVWLANLTDSAIEAKIPRENSNDFNPMWVGDTVYFLSDRNGPVTLFAYDTKSRQVKQLVKNSGLDLKSAAAGPGAIVYEQFGEIHLYELSGGRDRRVDVRLAGDLAEVRPHFLKVEPGRIRSAAISPTGARAVFGARGEILTVPAEKGDIRNLTNTVDVVERDPAWSPDGKSIAYMSDASGEYELHIKDQNGMGEARRINLGQPPTFYDDPKWAPDSKKIVVSDKRLNLWYVDLDGKAPVRVDTDTYAGPYQTFSPSWSPDSRWLAYTKQLRNYLHAVFIYSPGQGKSFQVTDGMSDAMFPVFDRDGKHLYFTASTDVALRTGWLDMSSMNHPISRSAYVVVLKKNLPSPLGPESDEEKAEAQNPADDKTAAEKDKKETPAPVEIDFEGIGQRILALPLPARNYTKLAGGKAGELFLVEGPRVESFDGEGPGQTVHKFEMKTRKAEKILEEAGGFNLSFNGEKMLYNQKGQWTIAPAQKPSGAPPKPGEGGPLRLDSMQVYVDPKAEWRHMYFQVWRNQRDFLYDPGLHGLNLEQAKKRYEPYLDDLASRDDLNYLFEEMLGELTIGHMFIGGGDRPETKKVSGGLLGADFAIENGRYRFARVFDGENWNPKLRAPLTQPGVNVTAGEYLLAVGGRELRASDSVYAFFESTAGKQVVLRVGPNPDGSGAREVTVVPVDDETSLRNLAWIEGNRRKVDQLTGGRVAYVYLPDTYAGGFTNFNRYYFAQVGKEAVIIDERFNGGGDIADYVIDYLRRPLLNMFTMREGQDITTPIEGIFGPKVMIINEMAGSGGDALPWMFRKAGIGPLVGKTTWGGLVGHYTNPDDLLDGGTTGTPNLAFYTDGKWDVENHGVPPDIEVEMDPKAVRQGHDPQLEKAVQVVMELLEKNPPPHITRPPFPRYH
jgi:tricorn protease